MQRIPFVFFISILVMEAFDLLEESWFFENLFDRRTRMLRCYSDPYTSPNFSQHVLSNGLVRAPSLPPCIGREDKVEAKKSNDGKIKLDRQLSLQTSKTSHKDNESDLRMSELIRQALVTSPEILPPRHAQNKVVNLQRCSKPPRNQEVEVISNTSEMRFRRSNPKRMLRKSHSDLAFQELQGFKDLGFTFDSKDLSPELVNTVPGLQGNQIDELEQDKVRKPYLSESWLVPPPIPAYASQNSGKDMKAQIKFWARAVATNVRQEC